MKKILFLLSFSLFTSLSFAQSDTIHITLKAKHFGFINDLTTDKGDADMVNIFNQVAGQLEVITDSLTGKKVVKDTAQLITVVTKTEVVPRMFLNLGGKPERISTNYNNEMRDFLIKDLLRKPAVLQEVQAIMERNAADTWTIVLSGLNYFITIKRQ